MYTNINDVDGQKRSAPQLKPVKHKKNVPKFKHQIKEAVSATDEGSEDNQRNSQSEAITH